MRNFRRYFNTLHFYTLFNLLKTFSIAFVSKYLNTFTQPTGCLSHLCLPDLLQRTDRLCGGKGTELRPAKMKQILGCIAVAVGFFFLIHLGKTFLQNVTIISKSVKILCA